MRSISIAEQLEASRTTQSTYFCGLTIQFENGRKSAKKLLKLEKVSESKNIPGSFFPSEPTSSGD